MAGQLRQKVDCLTFDKYREEQVTKAHLAAMQSMVETVNHRLQQLSVLHAEVAAQTAAAEEAAADSAQEDEEEDEQIDELAVEAPTTVPEAGPATGRTAKSRPGKPRRWCLRKMRGRKPRN